jgi:flagellar protein FlbD
MIKLTRLDGTAVYINEDYVEILDASPDSAITLHNGTTFVVKETPEKILEMIEKWNKKNRTGR